MHSNRMFFLCALIILVAAVNCTVVHAAPPDDESGTLAVSAGNTYYVAKNGNNSNDGSILHPWKTISKAASTAVAGSTVYVRKGTYREQVVVQNSGSPGKYITFEAYPGEQVTINGSGVSFDNWQGLVHIEGKEYIKFSGFRVVNSSAMGFLLYDSSHIIIRNNYITNTFNSAVLASYGSEYVIDGNEIEYVEHVPDDASVQEIISVQGYVDTFEVCNNHIHDCASIASGEGITAKIGVSNGKIYNNHIHHVVAVGIYVDAWNRHARDIEVYNNVVHDMWVRSGVGLAASAEDGGDLENITFYNNLAYNNPRSGIMIPIKGYGTLKNITVINNLCDGNADFGVDVGRAESTIQGILIRNNICSNNTDGQIFLDEKPAVKGVIIDHNLIDGFRGNPGETKGTCFMEGDPLFADPAHADFHAQDTSPAIDTGSAVKAPAVDYDGVSRLQGRGYDIGPFEHIEQEGPGYLSVLVPDGCNTWKQGTLHDIEWTFKESPGPSVKIVLVKAGVNNRIITKNTSIGVNGLGSYRWRIPFNQTIGTDYTLRVISISDSAYRDVTNASFAIRAGAPLTVTRPDGGEIWRRGTTRNITWKYAGNPGTAVKIQLLKSGVFTRDITKSTSIGSGGSGSYGWTIPLNLAEGTDYTVRVISVNDSTKRDMSNNVFSIG